MKGAYKISVQNSRVKYEFNIRRNITIVQGNSATGKTTLVDMIREHQLNGSDSGISLSCKKKCVVLEGKDWKDTVSFFKECIVFIDEGNRFVSSADFARVLRESDNYYVIFTREGLENLPYSVNEIYGIHSSGKYAGLKQTYHEFFHIYGTENNSPSAHIQKIVTEDSNSGFDFFKALSSKKYSCVAAGGKSNIFKILNESNENILVIADGAAFGSQMERVSKLIVHKKNAVLFLPESFEYPLLQSSLFKDSEITEILDSPSDFIDCKKYLSWEQFFTSLLIKKSENTFLKYSKQKLNPNYLAESIKSKILDSKAFSAIKDLFL